MTEAEAREIVERYETLIAEVIHQNGPFRHPEFQVSYPAEIIGKTLVVRENTDGDAWMLRQIEAVLS